MGDDEEEGGGAGWLVSFADLMTLLFAAFVVLYGITPRGESDEVLGVISAIRESFIEVPDEAPNGTARNSMLKGKVSFDEATRTSVMNPAIKKFNRISNPFVAPDQQLESVDIPGQKSRKGSNIHDGLRRAEHVGSWEIGPNFRRLEIVFFTKGSKSLSLKAKKVLRQLAPELRSNSNGIYLGGHTGMKRHSRLYSNLELSSLRAASVKKYLINDLGIPPVRMHVAAYGSQRPSAGLNISGGHSQDDRVEVKVINE